MWTKSKYIYILLKSVLWKTVKNNGSRSFRHVDDISYKEIVPKSI